MTDRALRELLRAMRAGGVASAGDARAALEAVLEALGAGLDPEEIRAVGHALPEALRGALGRAAHGTVEDESGLYTLIAERTGTAPGIAMERAQVALGALVEHLPAGVLHLLRERVAAGLRERLRERLVPAADRAEAPDVAPRIAGAHGSTLASGRPASAHPLSESAPPAPLPAAHETRLATARGLLAEREHRTIAEGHDGGDRPLGRSRHRA